MTTPASTGAAAASVLAGVAPAVDDGHCDTASHCGGGGGGSSTRTRRPPWRARRVRWGRRHRRAVAPRAARYADGGSVHCVATFAWFAASRKCCEDSPSRSSTSPRRRLNRLPTPLPLQQSRKKRRELCGWRRAELGLIVRGARDAEEAEGGCCPLGLALGLSLRACVLKRLRVSAAARSRSRCHAPRLPSDAVRVLSDGVASAHGPNIA